MSTTHTLVLLSVLLAVVVVAVLAVALMRSARGCTRSRSAWRRSTRR